VLENIFIIMQCVTSDEHVNFGQFN